MVSSRERAGSEGSVEGAGIAGFAGGDALALDEAEFPCLVEVLADLGKGQEGREFGMDLNRGVPAMGVAGEDGHDPLASFARGNELLERDLGH